MNRKYFFKQLFFTAMASIFIYAVSALFSNTVFADTASDFQSAQNYIQSNNLSGTLTESVNQQSTNIPINNNPTQTSYYKNTSAIATDSIAKLSQSGSNANAIQNGILVSPKYTVNKQSPEMQTGQLIQQNASAIADGTYKDCDKKDNTKIVYTNKTCETQLPFHFSCERVLTVAISDQINYTDQTENLSGRTTRDGIKILTVHLDSKEGFLKSFSINVAGFMSIFHCGRTYHLTINGASVAISKQSCQDRQHLQFDVNNLHMPFSNNTFQLSVPDAIMITGITGSVVLSVKTDTKVPVDQWSSSCSTQPSQCQPQSTCVEENETKTISGIPVTRSCWKYQDNYQCGGAESSQCTDLENQGCTEINNQCTQNMDGYCNDYTQTWSCPDKEVIGQGIACGKKFYCMNGNCQKTSTDQNKDFGKSVTQLAAVSSAGNDVKTQSSNTNISPDAVRMFAGQESECRVDALDFADCCADTGWGNGILANCSDQEKHLGKSKEKGIVVATGEYCRHHILGVCTEHRKTYCIFPSKLALDIQLHGRKEQLGIDFGNGKNTHCDGISPADIGRINFSKIDFSNVEQDIVNQKNLPDSSAIGKKIQEDINNNSSSSTPNPYSNGGL